MVLPIRIGRGVGGGLERSSYKTLCQICANLIDTYWYLVAQYATSVSASLTKVRINKLPPCFGGRGSEVQILSPRPFITMGYGLGRSLFLLWLALGLAFDMVCAIVCQRHQLNTKASFFCATDLKMKAPTPICARVFPLQTIGGNVTIQCNSLVLIFRLKTLP